MCERSAMSLTAFTHCSRNRPFPWGTVALVAASLAYPGIVYAAREVVPPLAFVTIALLAVAIRLATLRSPASRIWRTPLLLTIALIVATAAVNPVIASKAYPSVISLMTAAAFGASLLYPPSLIERFARLQEPDLPPEAAPYCRKVTIIWTLWLYLNAVIAAVLAVQFSDAAWALWTGFIAYVLMGALFVGEMAVRRVVRARAANK